LKPHIRLNQQLIRPLSLLLAILIMPKVKLQGGTHQRKLQARTKNDFPVV
jgi:hypothetical protein